ncbi:MAG: hypothetical protein P8126_05805 [Gammaproteobacteria bacterium]
MLPWNWTWSPQVNYPLSGSVIQDIEPSLDRFFAGIRPEAGIGSREKGIFQKASYGRQLGLILDVLLPLVDESKLESATAKESLARLKDLCKEIEEIKENKKKEMENSAVSLLKHIEKTDREMLGRVVEQFK